MCFFPSVICPVSVYSVIILFSTFNYFSQSKWWVLMFFFAKFVRLVVFCACSQTITTYAHTHSQIQTQTCIAPASFQHVLFCVENAQFSETKRLYVEKHQFRNEFCNRCKISSHDNWNGLWLDVFFSRTNCQFLFIFCGFRPFEWWIWNDKWFHFHFYDKRMLFIIDISTVTIDIVIVSVIVHTICYNSFQWIWILQWKSALWINAISIQCTNRYRSTHCFG